MSQATRKHYDQDVEFFQSFLDPYMKYTSGLFAGDGESLESAIARMLDLHLEFAGIKNGSRVLEIGSGWGALIRRMSEKGMNVEYVGVSPSCVQNDFIANHFRYGRVSLHTKTFETSNFAKEAFDAVVLSGSFCHLQDKEAELRRMGSLLKEGGRIVIEDTFFLSEELYRQHARHPATQYVQREIFGFAEILSWEAQLSMILRNGFEIDRFVDHTSSYKKTIEIWIQNLHKLDEHRFPLKNDYIKYLGIAQKGWGRTIGNYLVSLKRADIRQQPAEQVLVG